MSRRYTRRIIAIVEMETAFSVPDGRDQQEQLSVETGNLEYERDNLVDILKHTRWSVDHIRYGGVVPSIGGETAVVFADRVTRPAEGVNDEQG